MTESKEWVTIKIPAAVRDDASADPRTYEEIMRAGLEKGDGTASGSEVVVDAEALADRIVDSIGAAAGGPQVDDSEIAREVARQLDYTAIADKVADEVVGRLR